MAKSTQAESKNRARSSSRLTSWASLGELAPFVARRLTAMRKTRFAERFWTRDPTLWTSDPSIAPKIANRLGWLSVIEPMRKEAAKLREFALSTRADGLTHALLLGMGGSSLCPDVLRRTFGVAPGAIDLAILDSTSPAAVRAAERRAPIEKTLFIVATKSGTTIETMSFYRYFFDKLSHSNGLQAGRNFVAITDPGTPLVRLAQDMRFRQTFLNPPDIGGRYSALSYFGLVPAALQGIDLKSFLRPAADLIPTGKTKKSESHPAIQLGAILGEIGLQGIDKVTFILSHELEAFGCWAEQLVAESTGKQGRGLFPVDGETIVNKGSYGKDRIFVQIKLKGAEERATERKLETMERAGHPVIRMQLNDIKELGAEFLRWEIATAVASSVMGVNAFDEPNVTESKENSGRLLVALTAENGYKQKKPFMIASGVSIYGKPELVGAKGGGGKKPTAAGLLREFFSGVGDGDYLAVLAYFMSDPEREKLLQQMRHRVRDGLKIATSVGYGPRYLHSTGQFHKGCTVNGLYVILTAKEGRELPIPGQKYGFGTLIKAQALGDMEALEARGKRVIRIHMKTGALEELRHVVRWVERALEPVKPKTRKTAKSRSK